MPFDLHITIPDQSQAAQVLQELATSQHISTDQAATQLLIEGANYRSKKTPAQEMLGAFSGADDVALMDEVMEIVHARRLADVPRDFGL